MKIWLAKAALIILIVNIVLYIYWSYVGPSDKLMMFFMPGQAGSFFIVEKTGVNILHGGIIRWIITFSVILLNTLAYIFLVYFVKYFFEKTVFKRK
jgi:hypothetical protein